uniref:Ras-related GTP-binding protein n=1 Tax=Phaeomonas parva TaxID=124430 RepID=A0A7S1TXA5_9STRA|mmetsp:Transcript_21671/g.66355  ORF Transcript_21671/g.66355 Transcript_21671/m.66355 type:complete len:283 (+) Transcript_21671:76-924(+)
MSEWDYAATGYGGLGMPESVEVDPSILTEPSPKILLMGSRRSGKSSIYRVLFSKMSPHETLFLDSTNALEISRIANNKLITFQIWDFPGDFDPRGEFQYGDAVVGPATAYEGTTAVVICVDAQDELEGSHLQRIVDTAAVASEVNPNVQLHIFIHKVDGDLFPSEDEKLETKTNLHSLISDHLEENNIHIPFTYSLTSIYDNSISECFSKVVQKLIPTYHVLENLLNTLNSNCNLEKSFIFDVMSKLYLATDSSPVDLQTHELCSDMIDVVIDISGNVFLQP